MDKDSLVLMRKEVLSKFQSNAENLFTELKKISPDKNLFDYQVSLLILLANIPTTELFRHMLKMEIIRLVDAELTLGLLSKQQE